MGLGEEGEAEMVPRCPTQHAAGAGRLAPRCTACQQLTISTIKPTTSSPALAPTATAL